MGVDGQADVANTILNIPVRDAATNLITATSESAGTCGAFKNEDGCLFMPDCGRRPLMNS